MNKIAILLALSGGLILAGCSASAGGGSSGGGNDPKPVPATTTEDQLRILTAGKVPLLNGAPNTIDVIVHNASNLPVKGARFSLPSNMRNAQITSTNGCDLMIAPNSDCRVSLQFNAIGGTNIYQNQVVNVSYTNWKGNSKSAQGVFTAAKVFAMGDTPKINYVSMPNVMVDKGQNHLGGVAYFYVSNPANKPYTIQDIKFDSGAYSVVSASVSAGSQLYHGQLIEVEYDALKSTPLKETNVALNATAVSENGGYANLLIRDSLGSALRVGALSDYITGSYLVAGSLNPLNSAVPESEQLTVMNIGLNDTPTTVTVVSSDTNVAIVSALEPSSTIATNSSSSAIVSSQQFKTNSNMFVTVTGESNTIKLPLTVYSDATPSNLMIQPISYTFASSSGVSPSTVGESQNVVIVNQGSAMATNVRVSFSTNSPGGTVFVPTGSISLCPDIPAGGSCTIESVTIGSSIDQPNGIVQVVITYNDSSTGSDKTGGGIINYNAVERAAVVFTVPPDFKVVGNQNAINYESVAILNTSTNRSISMESWTLTNSNSESTWLYINNYGTCQENTQLPPVSAESCSIGLSLGPVTKALTFESQEWMTVTFVTNPLSPSTATSATESIPFLVTPDDANIILESYVANAPVSVSGDGASNPYIFLGSQNGTTHKIVLTYQNKSANNIKVNSVQHYNNPFYWILADGDLCSGQIIAPNNTCTITYTDNLYQYIANTTQNSNIVLNSLTLPGFFFIESLTTNTFAVNPSNPNSGNNEITSNEEILLLNHNPVESAGNLYVNMYSTPQVNTAAGDSVTSYFFSESTSIALNGIIESTGYISTGANCGNPVFVSGMFYQNCTGGSGLTDGVNYGIAYKVNGSGGSSGVSMTPTYRITNTSGNQAISQNTNQESVVVQ